MLKIDAGIADIGQLDVLAGRESWLHRLDPRVKVLVTLVFVVVVVSFDRYAVSQLLPFFFFPLALVLLGGLPLSYFLRKMVLLAPFVLFIGGFNPLLDRTVMLHLGPLAVSGGWLSFASIILRLFLTVSVALLLIASTGFAAVCMALERLGLPRVFAMQLLFLHRYLFVLMDEGGRLVRARALRSFKRRGTGLRVYGQLLGNLLLRTLDRAQRVHMAMRCRGFTGEIRLQRPMGIGSAEMVFAVVAVGGALLLRAVHLPRFIGNLIVGLF